MSSERDLEAAIAVTRLGMGARPGEIAAVSQDPRGWLKNQIRRDGVARPPLADGDGSLQRLTLRQQMRQARQMARQDGQAADARMQGQDLQKLLREKLARDFLARAELAASTPDGFAERWALFWANHFTVSATKLDTAAVAGAYEVEAIRPYVFKSFAELLASAETHPAMLLYLDQARSVGPNSPSVQQARGGRRARAGLNENLAREILELHTVGVDGGYSQADVTEFARALTGFTIGGRQVERDVDPAVSVFRAALHEPGERRIMGVRYAAGGREQAAAILRDLAAKPQTARFVCSKIARHFVADAPPPGLVSRLEKAWMSSGGDLARVAEALVEAPETWSPQSTKIKTPYEFVISSYRAAGAEPQQVRRLAPVLNGMGQKAFSAPSPEGWPDEAGAWASADGIVKRMQFAQAFANQAVRGRDPKSLAAEALGARLTPLTATAVARAESRAEGLALLLMSPEFQRR